ncbi:rho guanine nucleotide exchange factor 37 isoform X1 [Dendrobates tinctorius]|uniref:rho guanine nucleotide exchange factor 37 isoform X1 n=2 Tax=Dendrobates tinctorius TaxID=92724 RepID=UPI003CC94907
MAPAEDVRDHGAATMTVCEGRLSMSSNQSYRGQDNLNHSKRNSLNSPGFLSSSNNVSSKNHSYNDRLNLSDLTNHGQTQAIKSQLESIFSSASNSSNRPSALSLSSQSSTERSFDDSSSSVLTSDGHESASDDDSVTEANTFTEPKNDDSVFVTDADTDETSSCLDMWSFDDMDTPDPTGSDGIYENIPPSEEPIYDEVDGLRIAQPAVEELISSELSYVTYLRLLTSEIKPKLEKIPDIDVKSLFSNLDEILIVHESFLRELKQTENDQPNQLTRIGSLFQEFSKDMETVYTVYCYTYTRATSLLQHYQEKNVTELIRDALSSSPSSSSQYTDLSFYIVMPVQRIMKYPLLLKNILSTDAQDKDSRDAMQRAHDTMKEVNVNINENKRRKEVAKKYLQFDQRTIKEKVSTLNTHTISKKSQRVSLFIKQEAGIVPKRKDKEFDRLAERFHTLAAVVSRLEENLVSHVKNVEAYFLIQPETYPMEFLQGSVHPMNSYTLELCNSIYPTYKRRLQIMVLQPLSNLSEYLRGPKNLIRKRMDKLLDYENLEERHSETGKMTWEEEDIVNTYKTIHSMLLSELPSCIQLSYQLLHSIFLSFIAVQKDLAAQGSFAAEEHSSQMQCSTAPEPQFRKWVEDCIHHSISQISEFTKSFQEPLQVPISQEHIPVIERQIQQLLKRYSPNKLYQVMSNVKSTREMELTLSRGDVVAVIQCADVSGNKNRWLVDTGVSRGYILCSKLQPYQEAHSPARSQSPRCTQSSRLTVEASETRRHSIGAPVCPYPTSLPVQDINTAFQIVAGYSFTARSQYEVSITEGEPVTVLEPHDKNGSPEWSLIEVKGQKGYVPSSYLVRMPVQELFRRTSLGNYTYSS